MRKTLSAVLASILLLSSSLASAETADVNLAAELYRTGMKLMGEGKLDEACPKFAESLRIFRIANDQGKIEAANLGLASCYDKAGKTASAYAQYRDIAFNARSKGDKAREDAAMKKANDLEKSLSRLQINATATPGLVVRRDGQELAAAALGTSIRVDPGEHIIEATAPGYNVWSTTIRVEKPGSTITVEIPGLVKNPEPPSAVAAGGPGDVKQQPEKPNTTLRTAGFIVGGVGVAGLAVGATFGVLAMSQVNSAKDDPALCPNKVCTPAGRAEIDAANTKALISSIGIGVGAAAVATGVVLVVVGWPKKAKDEAAPPAKVSAQLVPSFGPNGGALSVVGSF